MSKKYLGLPFDIHGGGLDLQFPHHEAEIAQSYALYGTVPAKYWLYNNMVTIDKQKMSKSAGNFITLNEFFTGNHALLSTRYDPQIIRFFILRAHYRSLIDVSDQALQGAMQGFVKLRDAAHKAQEILAAHGASDTVAHIPLVGDAATAFASSLDTHMDNDMDTPNIIAELFKAAPYIQQCAVSTASKEAIAYAKVYHTFFSDILGLSDAESYANKPSTSTDNNSQLIDNMLNIRNEARSNKDFATADLLRNILSDAHITIKDNVDGSSSWEYTT